jgi:hypothetical protein
MVVADEQGEPCNRIKLRDDRVSQSARHIGLRPFLFLSIVLAHTSRCGYYVTTDAEFAAGGVSS